MVFVTTRVCSCYKRHARPLATLRNLDKRHPNTVHVWERDVPSKCLRVEAHPEWCTDCFPAEILTTHNMLKTHPKGLMLLFPASRRLYRCSTVLYAGGPYSDLLSTSMILMGGSGSGGLAHVVGFLTLGPKLDPLIDPLFCF